MKFNMTKALAAGLQENLDGEERSELKDSYYGIATNIHQTIDAIELALGIEQSYGYSASHAKIEALKAELKIYTQIKTLADKSKLGAIL